MGKTEHISDEHIVELYWRRCESAIAETANKYGNYCCSIAYNILHNTEDAQECVNDTYLDAWNNIPPHKPNLLSAFLGKITRRISIDRWRKKNAEKRGGGEMDLVLDELEDCLSDRMDVETVIEQQEMMRIIGEYLEELPVTERRVFLRRYWYMESISVISNDFGFTESKTVSMLCRTRKKLRLKLESEGYI